MPFNELMMNCIRDGTSHKENGINISIQRKPRETILFFVIDPESNHCSNFPEIINTDIICDLLIYYSTDGSNKKICLVELKGSDIKHAIEQLTRTREKTNNCLKSKYQNIGWKAIIVHRCSAPNQFKSASLKKRLDNAFGKGNYSMEHTTNFDAGEFIRK